MAYELTIRDPDESLEATFMPELGMVGCSLRHQGEELLGQLGGAAAYRDRGSTFGLPFLHPWANRLSAWEYGSGSRPVRLDPDSPITHADGATGLPIHGLLAASPHWQVVDADADRLRAELDFGAVPEYMEAFPFPHRLEYDARIEAGTLTIAITVTPTSELQVPVAFGFHPYLTLPGSERSEWQISLPVRRQVLLDDRMIPTGRGVLLEPEQLDGPLGDRTFDTSFDRLREDQGPACFEVADSRRRISVEFRSGYPVAQVYAPAGSDFICFEPMVAPIDALRSGDHLRFAQAQPFRAEFAIAVR